MNRVDSNSLARIQPTERDAQVLEALYRYGPLTTEHITELAFSGIKLERTRKNKSRDRLRKLFDHGYVDRDQLPRKDWESKKPLIYFLGRKGAEYLAARRNVSITDLGWKQSDNKVKPIALNHTIAVTDFMVNLELACREGDIGISHVVNEKDLKRATGQHRTLLSYETSTGGIDKGYLYPDQYFALENSEGKKAHFFLEIDLNTETLEYSAAGEKTDRYKRRDIARKISLYGALRSSGAFNELYGADTFRVLFVTTSKVRAQNMKIVTENAVDTSNFYFTLFDYVKPANLLQKPIWIISNKEEPSSLL